MCRGEGGRERGERGRGRGKEEGDVGRKKILPKMEVAWIWKKLYR